MNRDMIPSCIGANCRCAQPGPELEETRIEMGPELSQILQKNLSRYTCLTTCTQTEKNIEQLVT